MRFATTALFALPLALAGCGKGADQGNSAGGGNAPLPAAVRAPTGQDWLAVTAPTPDGGFVQGNPNARIKIVEYGSLTCPHCQKFAVESLSKVRDAYVKTGLASYEYRNVILNGPDIVVSLLARCGGATTFFPLADQIYADQPNWEAKMGQISKEDQARLQALPPNQQGPFLARKMGFDTFMQMRGIPAARMDACINDAKGQADIQKLGEAGQRDQVNGVPAFFINGKRADGAYDFATLDPAIKAAL